MVCCGSTCMRRSRRRPAAAAPSCTNSECDSFTLFLLLLGLLDRPCQSQTITSALFVAALLAPAYCLRRHSRCRLVGEVKRLKGGMRAPAAPAGAPDATAGTPVGAVAAQQLVSLLGGLGTCVSLVQERRHELLLKELLDTPLWQVPQVGVGWLVGAGCWFPGRLAFWV
mgnify:CR=1 FL=1